MPLVGSYWVALDAITRCKVPSNSLCCGPGVGCVVADTPHLGQVLSEDAQHFRRAGKAVVVQLAGFGAVAGAGCWACPELSGAQGAAGSCRVDPRQTCLGMLC